MYRYTLSPRYIPGNLLTGQRGAAVCEPDHDIVVTTDEHPPLSWAGNGAYDLLDSRFFLRSCMNFIRRKHFFKNVRGGYLPKTYSEIQLLLIFEVKFGERFLKLPFFKNRLEVESVLFKLPLAYRFPHYFRLGPLFISEPGTDFCLCARSHYEFEPVPVRLFVVWSHYFNGIPGF